MFRLFRYALPYKWLALLGPLFMMIEVSLELLQPRFMARIIDEGIAKGNLSVIGITSLWMMGTTLLAMLGGVGCTVFSSMAAMNFGTDLRAVLFKKVLSLSFASTDRFSTASLITRLTQDVQQMQMALGMLMRVLVRDPLMCLGGIFMALQMNPRMGVVLLAMIPPILVMVTITYKYSRPMFKAIQEKIDKLNAALQENLLGIRVVKAFVREDYEEARFRDANEKLAAQQVATARFMSLMRPLSMLLVNIGILAILWLGGWSVRQGSLTVGEVMAMINYTTRILFSFMMVSFIMADIGRIKVSAARLNEILDSETTVKNDGTLCADLSQEGVGVAFEHVSFKYPGASGSNVLHDISFTLPPGKTMAIMGATGSGKSTLVHLLPRFYDCLDGRIILDGHDIRDYELSELRKMIGMVLQDSILFSGTISENIRWGNSEATDEQVAAVAEASQAAEFIGRFKDGMETVVGQRGVTLSGGQKQRLSIARALLKRPRLLILDDSTSALDGTTEQRLQDGVRAWCRGMTVIKIAQRISSVKDADAILVLQDGKIVGLGTHEELLKSCMVYQEIVESQKE